jgi:hypothetical protein
MRSILAAVLACSLLLVASVLPVAQSSPLTPESASALLEIAQEWKIGAWLGHQSLIGKIGQPKTDSVPGVTVSPEGEITHMYVIHPRL